MPGKLTKRCEKRLEGVHPDLVAVVLAAVKRTEIPFRVTEGARERGLAADTVAAIKRQILGVRDQEALPA